MLFQPYLTPGPGNSQVNNFLELISTAWSDVQIMDTTHYCIPSKLFLWTKLGYLKTVLKKKIFSP